jgi:hypothetical protein
MVSKLQVVLLVKCLNCVFFFLKKQKRRAFCVQFNIGTCGSVEFAYIYNLLCSIHFWQLYKIYIKHTHTQVLSVKIVVINTWKCSNRFYPQLLFNNGAYSTRN